MEVTGFNMDTLRFTVPTSWQQLSDKQLRYVFRLLAADFSVAQLKVLCLLRFNKAIVVRQEGAIFIVRHNRKLYPLSALQLTEATESLAYLGDIPSYPVRLKHVGTLHLPLGGGRRGLPVRADFQDVSFNDFLTLDNLYQGYLQTQRGDLLREMAKVMYRSSRVRLNRTEEVCIFYWFTSVKQMFARMFRNFFKNASADDGMPHTLSFEQLQESMNTQIRALTNGDITKEREVLAMDCWRALTELDAKARDYEELRKAAK